MRRSYRFLTRHESAKLELNFIRKTNGRPKQREASRLRLETSQRRLEEKARYERRYVECDLNRRKNREVCLQRAIGRHRRHISEKEWKISHDPAAEYPGALDAKTSGSRF
jgi:hypothetical protein